MVIIIATLVTMVTMVTMVTIVSLMIGCQAAGLPALLVLKLKIVINSVIVAR